MTGPGPGRTDAARWPVHSQPLVEADADGDPLVQFGRWFEAASAVVRLPEAMALATATASGRPSLRMVLCKGFDADGFVFTTDFGSRKAQELAANPWAAVVFHWDPLGRQVRLEGPVEKLGQEASDAAFAARARGAQISATASNQSRPIASRRVLDEKVAAVATRFDGRPVPRPEDWGGYRLRPACYEFWQSRDDRLHDRLRYVRKGNGWRIERLQP